MNLSCEDDVEEWSTFMLVFLQYLHDLSCALLRLRVHPFDSPPLGLVLTRVR
jgi:hypothetical protein